MTDPALITVLSATVGALISLAGQGVAGWFAARRDINRQTHESAERLKEHRIKTYSEFLKVTSTLNENEYRIDDLAEAFSGVESVAGDDLVVAVAKALYSVENNSRKRAWEVTKEGRSAANDPEFQALYRQSLSRRSEFRKVAWRQIGLESVSTPVAPRKDVKKNR